MSKSKGEFYISVDVEALGPCPGLHSMVQLGAVFYDAAGTVLCEFSRNLYEIPGAFRDPDTMAWWDKQIAEQPLIWKRLMEDRVEPEAAMYDFTTLVKKTEKETGCRPVVVCYPAGFDFTFLYWYLHKFTGRSCVGFSCLDLKTLSMALILGKGYRGFGKKDMPKEWFSPDLRHDHDALHDAREQGHLLQSMLKAVKELHARLAAAELGWA